MRVYLKTLGVEGRAVCVGCQDQDPPDHPAMSPEPYRAFLSTATQEQNHTTLPDLCQTSSGSQCCCDDEPV